VVSVTLSVPEEVREKMQRHDEINWSAFVRKCIIEKTESLEALERWSKEEKDISDWSVRLQRKAREGRFEWLQKKGLV
jgi:hypothetical protein